LAPISPVAWIACYLKRLAPWLLIRLSRAMRDRTLREVERRRVAADP